jgi:hypothetical protein
VPSQEALMSKQENPLDAFSRMELEVFYSELDEQTSVSLQGVAKTINDHKSMQVEIIVDIGRHLQKAKALLDHGQFSWWLGEACAFTHRTAVNYMHVAEQFGEPSKMETVSNLKFRTLYALAAPSTPEHTRKGILRTLRKNRQTSDSTIMHVIETGKFDESQKKLLSRFGHLSHSERNTALMEHYAEQAELREDKEHQVQIRLQAVQRLYRTLIGSGLNLDQLVNDLEEAGIAYLPAMIANRDEIPPGLRDANGELIRELEVK